MTNLTHKFKVLQTAQLIPSIARPAADTLSPVCLRSAEGFTMRQEQKRSS